MGTSGDNRLTTRSLALEVRPERRAALAHAIDRLRGDTPDAVEGRPGAYDAIVAAMPTLHFFSLSVFDSPDYDPLLIVEANFDGPCGPFWAQLQAVLGEQLRQMLRCCKKPEDGLGTLFESIVADRSKRDIAPYLEALTRRPKVWFHGSRGMPRARILAEARLYREVQRRLGNGGNEWRGLSAVEVRDRLRQELEPGFAWLARSAGPRVRWTERAASLGKLAALLGAVLYALCLPGITLAAIIGDERLLAFSALAAMFAWIQLRTLAQPLEGVATARNATIGKLAKSNPLHLGIAALVLFAIGWPATVALDALASGNPLRDEIWTGLRQFAWGFGWFVLIEIPLLLVWLRWLERRDSSLTMPQTDPVRLMEMAQVEDWVPQNHMGSIVPLRPQLLRRALVFIGEPAVHLALQTFVRDGYLGSMRTIHAAHWTLVNNGSRLLFLSNFDLSWETYFDDFIEKAHEGLTLVWGSSVGFPPTTMLIRDGAAHGRMFKEWARHSMAVSRFWVSAYPDLTVDQIERNWRVAEGLRGGTLTPAKAALWATDL